MVDNKFRLGSNTDR